MQRSVEVEVGPDGSLNIEAKDFKGADCEKATKYIEDALGVVQTRRKKAEYYQKATTKNQQKLGG